MATIYDAIASFITTNIAQVGNVPAYLGYMPQGVNPPAIVFSLVSGAPLVSHDGENTTRAERFQFSCVSEYLSDAVLIREDVRNLLKTLPGTYTDIIIQSCVPMGSPRDRREDETLRWNAQQDFLLYYTVVTGG
jgi:hypothetical protein